MTLSSDTRKRRLKRVVHICRAFCKSRKISAGCANGEHDRLCGPSNCEVYRQMVKAERS